MGVVRVAVTFSIVTLAWIFFRVPDAEQIEIILARMAFVDREVAYWALNEAFLQNSAIVAVACAVSAIALDSWKLFPSVLNDEPTSRRQLVGELAVVNWLAVTLVLFGDPGSNAFVYFAF